MKHRGTQRHRPLASRWSQVCRSQGVQCIPKHDHKTVGPIPTTWVNTWSSQIQQTTCDHRCSGPVHTCTPPTGQDDNSNSVTRCAWNIGPGPCENRLREAGLRARWPFRGVILTQQHRLQGRQWCQVHRVWPQQHWRRVWFSNESRFLLRRHNGRRRNERFAANCVREVDRFGGGSIMMWAAISYTGRTNLVTRSRQPDCSALHWCHSAATRGSRYGQHQRRIPAWQCQASNGGSQGGGATGAMAPPPKKTEAVRPPPKKKKRGKKRDKTKPHNFTPPPCAAKSCLYVQLLLKYANYNTLIGYMNVFIILLTIQHCHKICNGSLCS